MISRYSRKELTSIWSEENKYKIWLDVEIAAAQAMENLGHIPRGVSSIVKKKSKINVKRIHAIESKVKHDVIAFLTSYFPLFIIGSIVKVIPDSNLIPVFFVP